MKKDIAYSQAATTNVYVLSGAPGLHKVGIANDVERRRRSIQAGSPARLAVQHVSAVEKALAAHVEAYAHWLLREGQEVGEWFRVERDTAIAAVAAALTAVRAGERKGRVGVGRPALGVISTTIRLPKTVLERIDALMGANRRAQFIREAVENELKRREGQGSSSD